MPYLFIGKIKRSLKSQIMSKSWKIEKNRINSRAILGKRDKSDQSQRKTWQFNQKKMSKSFKKLKNGLNRAILGKREKSYMLYWNKCYINISWKTDRWKQEYSFKKYFTSLWTQIKKNLYVLLIFSFCLILSSFC